MARFGRIRSVLAVALCAALLPAAAAQAETTNADPTVIWQWNVGGSTIHHGASNTGMVDGAVASIINRNADFVAFNELCKGQWDSLVAKLRTAGWPQDSTNFARFEPSINAGGDACGGAAFGNAIFSKLPLGTADRIALPDDPSPEQRNMLCAPLRDFATTRFCTTHIAAVNTKWGVTNAHKVAQLAAVQVQLDSWVGQGQTVMIAGDFNAQPHYSSLNTYYSASLNVPDLNDSNSGSFRELDDNDSSNCLGYGEWTADNPDAHAPLACGSGMTKIDLIFVSEASLLGPGSYSADSLAIAENCQRQGETFTIKCSDHRILTGTVNLK
ncbi:endonuclease/exonuclease/phosphatase family protein [Streptomyces sp. NPDC048266]|uniref:endonuclease/exonuclease/phosphatase family protein n=1 Tax=Streptomyces sp. NPDC048266 TaxID=3155787 RepID=UPI0034088BA9